MPQARESDPKRSRLRWLVVVGVGLVAMLPVNKIRVASSLQPGELVVFDGTRTFAGHPPGTGSQRGSAAGSALDAVASMLSTAATRQTHVPIWATLEEEWCDWTT